MMITWRKLGGNRPPGDNPLLVSLSGTGSLNLYAQSHRNGWTYIYIYIYIYTKAFDYHCIAFHMIDGERMA